MAALGNRLLLAPALIAWIGLANGCLLAEPGDGSCRIGDTILADGSSLPADDQCNTCSCNDSNVFCTERVCATAEIACGARAGETCEADEYCAYVNGDCGFADGTSTCRVRPDFCPEVIAPVCGCDGKTYDNACVAAVAGHGYLSEGPCPGQGSSCEVDGVTYADGAGSILSSDGCNVCFCNDGLFACTLHLCEL